MTISLPPGRFRDAVIQRGYGILSWVFGWFSFLILLLFVPWVRVFEGVDQLAIAPRTYEVLSRGEPLEMWPFAFAAIGLLILLGLYGLWRGLVSAFSPESSGPAKALTRIGDPVRLLADFEAEARDPVVDVAKPRILITRSWLLFGDSIQVNLVPLSEVLWAYGKQGKTGHAVAGLFGAAGVISSRQRRLATQFDDPAEAQLVLHMRGDRDSIVLNVMGAQNQVLMHLLHHAPHMVIGHDETLAELWERDPAAFARKGRTLGGLQAPQAPEGAPPPEGPSGRTLFGNLIRQDERQD